ncbi:MAG: hypothetical protein ACREMA_06140 [Longimicrobiales bacterium]
MVDRIIDTYIERGMKPLVEIGFMPEALTTHTGPYRQRIGGPHVTGPNGARTQQILRNFIEHCLRGTNYATGKIGTPLDLICFHDKGAPRVMPEGHVRMSVSNQAARHRQRLRHRGIISGVEEHAHHYRRIRSRGLCRLTRADQSVQRVPQRHHVLELHRRAAGAHLRAGRSARRQLAGLGDLGFRVRGTALLRWLP